MTLYIDRTIAETYFSSLDRHFADYMVELTGEAPPDSQKNLWLAAALVSASVGRGHVCLNLADIAGMPIETGEDGEIPSLLCPRIGEWIASLKGLSVVGSPGEFKPLILDEKLRLYLYRYWLYEQQLANSILTMAGSHLQIGDKEILADSLKRLFPVEDQTVNWQCIAAILAVLNRFTVISGGPGTGKTHTVARILALLVEQTTDAPLSIALAAPTGKAAARLTDMVRAIKEELNCSSEVKACIPEKAFTIHRLLGPIYGGKTFRYNEANRLPFHVVVVDEASMVDLPLMAKLASALEDGSRLLLLGDKDQLASVEPGAVFGDICETGRINTFSRRVTGVAHELLSVELPNRENTENVFTDSIVVLTKSYRFGSESGIGQLASAVRECRLADVFALLTDTTYPDICWRETPSIENMAGTIEETFSSFYTNYLTAGSLEEAFSLFGRFHLLCALRQGPYGAVSLNRIITHMCRRMGLIQKKERWYPCEPVMITKNDYQLMLFNGDVGIVFPDWETEGQLRVFFPADGGGYRRFLPSRLKNCETLYAMTVHKSQGSEFDHVVLLLPDHPSKVITRELIYTAITRARKRVEIWGTEHVLRTALSQTTRRESGLRDILIGGTGTKDEKESDIGRDG